MILPNADVSSRGVMFTPICASTLAIDDTRPDDSFERLPITSKSLRMAGASGGRLVTFEISLGAYARVAFCSGRQFTRAVVQGPRTKLQSTATARSVMLDVEVEATAVWAR
jgi:hypothetical protein